MSVNKKWFFLVQNEVQGPFDKPAIEKLAGENPSGLIWGQGLNEWIKHEEWQKTLTDLDGILTSLQSDMMPQWRIKQGDFEAGPFIYDELIQVLKTHPQPGNVSIVQGTGNDWQSIYAFPTVVEEVGITRRTHERVPISGLFVYEKEGARYDSLLFSLSEGGIGILEARGLSVGDVVKGVIECPQLPAPIPCTCEVLYRQNDESWGLRFVNLPIEMQSMVISYTRKFLKV